METVLGFGVSVNGLNEKGSELEDFSLALSVLVEDGEEERIELCEAWDGF